MYKIERETSERISALRLLLMILVVFIHNYADGANFVDGRIDFVTPEWLGAVKYIISNIIARTAVPLFFVISGILLYANPFSAGKNIGKKVKSILIPYLFWNTAWIIFFLIGQSVDATRGFFPNSNRMIADFGIAQWLNAYTGWKTGLPFLYPFWFLRDLFILNIFALPIKKLSDRFPALTLTACIIPWICGLGNSSQSVLFFVLGYYIVKYGISIRSVDRLGWADLGFGYALTIAADYFFGRDIPVLHSVCIVMGMIFLTKLSRTIVRYSAINSICLFCAPYVFIIYACHEFTLSMLRKILSRILPSSSLAMLLQYLCLPLAITALCVFAGIILKRLLPTLYRISTGNR